MSFNLKPSPEYIEFVRKASGSNIWILEDLDDSNPFLDSLKSAFAYYQNSFGIQNKFGCKFNFEAFFVEDKHRINAFVGKIGQKYCICMNTLTLFFVKNLSNYLFADDYFMSFLSSVPVGKVARPNRLGKDAIGEFVKLRTHPVDLKQCTFNDYKPPFKPLREERAKAADFFSNIMLEMIWFHEIGHILSGHVDYMHDSFRINMISEEEQRTSSSSNFILPLERQAMEVYADICAIQPRLRIAKDIFSSHSTWFGLTVAQYASIFRMAFYLLNLTWCFTNIVDEEDSKAIVKGLSHPPSANRLFFGNEHFSNVMEDLGFDKEVVEKSDELHTQQIKYLFGCYEVFYCVAAAIQMNQDKMFTHAYKMNGARKYAEKWHPFGYLSEA